VSEARRFNLPESWTTEPLGAIADESVEQLGPRGSTSFTYVDISAIDNDSKRIVAQKNVDAAEAPSRARQNLRVGDVIVSMTRPNLNAVALVGSAFDGAIGSTGLHVLRSEVMEPAWLYYAVQTREFVEAMCSLVQGALYPAVRPKDIDAWSCPVPPLAEQRRIADMLDELFSDLDAGITALERARAKLKLYRASVLKAAVEGTLTADWRAQHPDAEPASELLKRILVERCRRWEDVQLRKFKEAGKPPPKNWTAKYKEPAAPDTSNLPALPEGWSWASLDQLGETQGGLQKSPARAPKKNHYPYLRVANVLRGALDLCELHRFELSDAELERLRLAAGDLLIIEGNGSRTEIGRCAIWRGEVGDCVHQNHVIRVRLLAGIKPEYVYRFLNSPAGQVAIQLVASSTSGLYTLSVGKIEKLPIPVPPEAEQDAIIDAVDEQLSALDHLEADLDAKLKSAQALRQSILRDAFAGKLVPQDMDDEPASVLLERIAAGRAQREREVKASKRAPSKRRATRKRAKTSA